VNTMAILRRTFDKGVVSSKGLFVHPRLRRKPSQPTAIGLILLYEPRHPRRGRDDAEPGKIADPLTTRLGVPKVPGPLLAVLSKGFQRP
jgi:hypothetical protein